jgi:hypothetical protein
VQWPSDNGSIFAAGKTIEITLALNLVPRVRFNGVNSTRTAPD